MVSSRLSRWLAERAVPVPPDPAPDVVGARVGASAVVGLGAAVRHAADTLAAMRSVTEDLVARHGFRAVFFEGTDPPFSTAPALDRFLVEGVGDPRVIVAKSQGFLHHREFLDLVLALRARNVAHPGDPVRIVHDLATKAVPTTLAAIERDMADRVLAWRESHGHKVVHWGGAAHILAGDPRGVSPGGVGETHRNAGGHLRAALGDAFVAVAATVGQVDAGDGYSAIPPTPASFTEAPFAALPGTSWIPVRGVVTLPEVTAWLDAPLRTRMVGPVHDPDRDEEHHMSAPSVRRAVDAFLHRGRSRSVSPDE